jgi:hypothetical protein
MRLEQERAVGPSLELRPGFALVLSGDDRDSLPGEGDSIRAIDGVLE